jgi:adenine phosphoribosyltransferase
MPDTAPTPASLAGFDLKAHIRAVPDFPKPGILFYDICTLLRDGPAFHAAIQQLAALVRPYKPTALAGIESRGFVLAAPLALELGIGFILLRKPRKLPGATIGYNYALEYGTDRLEIQADAVATGGTMAAGIRLLKEAGAEVPLAAAMIELTFLNGRARLEAPFEALAAYDS